MRFILKFFIVITLISCSYDQDTKRTELSSYKSVAADSSTIAHANQSVKATDSIEFSEEEENFLESSGAMQEGRQKNERSELDKSDSMIYKEFIKDFYEKYLLALESNEEGKVDSVTSRFCTKELIAIIEKSRIDYSLDHDPFLSAQDYDKTLLNTLEVRAEPQEGVYRITYTIWGNDVATNLKLVNQEGKIKISSTSSTQDL